MSDNRNQSEGEFFALVATGTKAIESIFDKYGATMLKRAAPNLKDSDAFAVWSTNVIFEITSDEKLAPVLNTQKGVISAYKSITRAAVNGIMIGGTKPQAYFVPRDGRICLDVADRGMEFAAVYGPGAVLARPPRLVKIFENDGLRIDEARGRIIYPEGGVSVFGEGKLIGYAMELEYIDGRREVERITLAKVRQIEDRYGQKNSPMYAKSPEEADEKTARKQLLKRAFGEAGGLAMMRALGGTIIPETGEAFAEDPPRDQGERVGARMDAAMRNVSEEPEEEDEEKPAAEPEPKKADDSGQASLDVF